MDSVANKLSDLRLLDAIQGFVSAHPHADVQRFRDGITAWGNEWRGVRPTHLPAADTLTSALQYTTNETSSLVALFENEKSSRRWEQSYTREDGVVGDDMLAAYGFAEVIGKLGPFVSTRVRSGIGVWGPNIEYPAHRHTAEEVYVLLAGSAEFILESGDGLSTAMRNAGDSVYVPSMLTHGFRTKKEPLAILYIWQAGDLREISTFSTQL